MGAKLTAEFYEKGALDKTQCLKLATFCSTGGPIFIIGTVGGVYLKKRRLREQSYLISHILGALANGSAIPQTLCLGFGMRQTYLTTKDKRRNTRRLYAEFHNFRAEL